jgi:hypothetical protein
MGEEPAKNETELTFAKAYDFIKRDRKLCASEKLVVIEVCRYYPSPYWGSATTLSNDIGMSVRYARNLVAGLLRRKGNRKAYLRRQFYKRMDGRDTRVLVPLCFPAKKAESVSTHGEQGECTRVAAPLAAGVKKHARGQPPIRTVNKKEEEKEKKGCSTAASPAPSPIGALASAAGCVCDNQQRRTIEQLTQSIGKPVDTALTPKQFEQRRQKVLDGLRNYEHTEKDFSKKD